MQLAEEELRFQKSLLEAQSEAFPDGILVVSAEGRMISFNRRFVEMWEIPEEIVASRSDEAALESVYERLADPEEFLARVRYLYERPDEESRDEIRLKDGRTFDRYSAPVRDTDGHHYGRVWFFRDVTEDRLIHEERATLLAAEQAARAEADAALERAGRLQAIADAALTHLRLDDLLRELLGQVREGLGSDTATILLMTDDGKNLAVRATSGEEEEPRGQIRVPMGEGIAGTVAARREARIVDDVPAAGPYSEFLRRKIRSLIAVPLGIGERVIGVLHAGTRKPHRFTKDDLRLMTLVAERAAVAIENARLYEDEQQLRRTAEEAASRILVLQAVTAALSEAASVSDVADVVLDKGLAVLGAIAGSVAVLMDDGETLEVVRAVGYPEEMMARWARFSLEAPMPLADAIRAGGAILLRSREERRQRYPHLDKEVPIEEDWAWAAIPLVVEGRALGVLGLNFEQPRELRQEEMALLQALARQAAQAIERARLYEAERMARADAESAQGRLRFLAEASQIIGASLDLDVLMWNLARLVVPRLADWCLVDLLKEEGTLQNVAIVHVDPGKEELARRLREHYPPDRARGHPVWNVLRSGQSLLSEQVTEAELAGRARDEQHLEILKRLSIRSHIVVPLTARGRTLGAISFVLTEPGRTYGPTDLALAEDLARRAALAVDNAHLYQLQRHVARTLQGSLLPPSLPEIPGLEVAARYRPAGEGNEVGGDFYDVFATRSGAWAVVIGDVCGKGPEAAAVTGMARHTIRASAMYEERPSRILSMLNDVMMSDEPDTRFCTVALVRVRPNDHGARLTIASGGHPLPLILRADGSVEAAGKPGGLLGVFPEFTGRDQPVDLGPGEALVLYTDGVVEQRGSNSVDGERQLLSLLVLCRGLGAAEIADAVEQGVLAARPEGLRDDVALLVLRVEK